MVHRGKRNQRRLITIILPFAFVFLYQSSMAQPISLAMQFPNPVRANDSNGVYFSYSNLFYFRDYEYFNKIQTGYTLLGTWNYPRITLQPNKHLRLEAGVLLQKDFGDRTLNKAEPMFSLQYQAGNFQFIAGAMEGNQTHGLIEPLMSYDKVIERPIEEGLQIKYKGKRLRADLWLDWNRAQKENSDYSEELTGGLSLSVRLTKPGKALQLELPFGFIMPHKGGELDTNHSVVTTTFNKSGGIAATWKNPDRSSWLKIINGELHGVTFNEHQKNVYPYTSGYGVLGTLKLQSKWDISVSATYWKGHHFIAPRGAGIYQSISSIKAAGFNNYREPTRQLLFLNLMYDAEVLPGFYVDLRYTPYIDINNKVLESSFLILLSYRTSLRFCKIKR
jgi:hypothetical protein